MFKLTIHFATNSLRQFDAGGLYNTMAWHPGLGRPCAPLHPRQCLAASQLLCCAAWVHGHITSYLAAGAVWVTWNTVISPAKHCLALFHDRTAQLSPPEHWKANCTFLWKRVSSCFCP